MNDSSLIGSKLGKYQIQAEIGRGGMGAVFKGYDPLLDRHVAIKVLAPHLVWQEGFVERFLREARAAARLQHNNIVTIHDVGQEDNWYYYVMEYLAGQTLTQIIGKRDPLSSEEALSILQPLAQALDFAHQSGLVHRDIKPSNIIVGPVGRVTLTDFGIARAAQETGLTTTGSVVGTPEYMSPEQVKGLKADARSDQYSLAVVAYEMLSGCVPFEAENTLALMYKVANEPPPSILESRPNLPAGVEDVLNKALAKEPQDRFPTVSAFVEAMGKALAGKRVKRARLKPTPPPADPPTVLVGQKADPRATPSTPRPSAPPVPAHRHVPGWVWALGGLAILLLLVGLGMTLGGGGGDGTPIAVSTPSAVATSDGSLPRVGIETPVQPTATLAPTRTPDRASTDTPTPAPTSTQEPSRTPAPSPTSSQLPTGTSTLLPSSTSTRAPTHTSASVPTETLVPERTFTPKPTPRPTNPVPTVTKAPPTTSARFPAPALLEPADGREFSETDQIVLKWQPAGSLPADAYYEVVVAYAHQGETWYDETPWTKYTSWTLSEHRYLLDLSDDDRFHWSVRVMQQTGTDADGRPQGMALSPASEERVLTWRAAAGGGDGGNGGGRGATKTPPPP